MTAPAFTLPVPSRPCPAIMCDLAAVRLEIARYDGVANPTDEQDSALARLEDRLGALEAEAKAAVEAATGVAWILLERTLA